MDKQYILVTTAYSPSQALLNDILDMASRSIDYWARYLGDSQWEECDETDNGMPCRRFTLDHNLVMHGIELLLNKKLTNKAIREQVLLALIDEDQSDLDAEAVDCIVQAAVFKEIVYG